MKLERKVAAITGGTAGIGRTIAEAFIAEGARVAVMARGEEKARAMLNEVGAGDNLRFIRGDATVRCDVESFIDRTVETFGQIDILVNNAGGAGDLQPMVSLTDEAFDLAMKWNVYSTFWATRRALKNMLPRGWGRIINLSSVEGKHGKPVFTAYTTAKHAINGMTKSVAREVGSQGVTVNSICPGLIVTDIIRSAGPATAEAMGLTFDEMIELFAKDSAIQRPNLAEEVAAVAVLLASEVGGGITGSNLSVDGGTAQY